MNEQTNGVGVIYTSPEGNGEVAMATDRDSKEGTKEMNQPEMKQERPNWCPHKDCIFLRQSQNSVCGGELPEPTKHTVDGFTGVNTHQFCLKEGHESTFEVNASDLAWFRWIFDGLDGKVTSWISQPLCKECSNPMTKVTEYTCDCEASNGN